MLHDGKQGGRREHTKKIIGRNRKKRKQRKQRKKKTKLGKQNAVKTTAK
jgi:hypothetical protein